MGRDKALLEVQGEPMAVRGARALSAAGAAEVIAVGGDADGLSAVGLSWVADEWPGEGPLGGVITALRHFEHDVVFVGSCDLLSPSPGAMSATVAALVSRSEADLAVPVRDGARQWLHGAWRRRAVDAVTEQLNSGERAIHRAVRSAGLTVIEVDDLDPLTLQDKNAP